MNEMCRHYHRPLHSDICKMGVNYRELSGGEDFGWRARLPCVTTGLSKQQVSCDKYQKQTEEDLLAEVKQMNRLHNTITKIRPAILATKLKNGTVDCSECAKKVFFSVASNGHVWAKCETNGCVMWIE